MRHRTKYIPESRFYRELFLRQDEIKDQVKASIRHRNDVNSQIGDLYENRIKPHIFF